MTGERLVHDDVVDGVVIARQCPGNVRVISVKDGLGEVGPFRAEEDRLEPGEQLGEFARVGILDRVENALSSTNGMPNGKRSGTSFPAFKKPVIETVCADLVGSNASATWKLRIENGAEARVRARHYPDGRLAVFHGPGCLVRFDADGETIDNDVRRQAA